MKKVLYIVIGILVLAAVAFPFLRSQTKKHSPAAVAEITKEDLHIQVSYCRPSKKGRVVFGDESAGALQPFGKYWRVGANEATVIEFSKDVLFGGQEVKAGKYNLYAYPGREQWEVCLGSDWDRWGYNEASKDKEVVRVMAPADNAASPEEQFLISFDDQATLQLHWDQTLVKIPIAAR